LGRLVLIKGKGIMKTVIEKLKSKEFKRKIDNVMYTGMFTMVMLMVFILPMYIFTDGAIKQNIEEKNIIETISNGSIDINSIEQLVKNHKYKINIAGTELTVLVDDIDNYKLIGLDSENNIILLEKK